MGKIKLWIDLMIEEGQILNYGKKFSNEDCARQLFDYYSVGNTMNIIKVGRCIIPGPLPSRV